MKLAGILALLLLAGTPATAQADRIEELYRKAAKEGRVVWYASIRKSYYTQFSKWWKKRFPKVKFTFLRKAGEKLIQTVEAERAAGRIRADVTSISVPFEAAVWKKRGLYEPYKPAQFAKIPDVFKDPEGHWITRAVFLLIGAYNTNLIKDKKDLPRSLKDYLDLKWKKKILSASPTTAGSSLTFFGGLIQSRLADWNYLEKLASQDLMFVRSNGEAARMIVAGERPLALAISSHNIFVAKDQDQPIDFFVHEDGAIINQLPTGIMKGTKHPWAARLLIEWQFTDEGQRQIVDWGRRWSVMRHIGPPKGLPNVFSFKLVNPDLSFLGNEKEGKSFLDRFRRPFKRM